MGAVKILVEAFAADFGGIRTYVENVLRAWPQARPEDELVVVVPTGSDLDTGDHRRVEVRVRRPVPVFRPAVQTFVTPRLARHHGVDAVLSTHPATSLRRLDRAHAVVIYDFRHELRPEQFSGRQRLLRRISYLRGYEVADGIISISQRTLDDLQRLHPTNKPTFVAHLGGDHVLTWPPAERTDRAITFAHHTNKNVDLILDGWAQAPRTGDALPPLLVLGAGSARAALEARIFELGLGDRISVAQFLPQTEFEAAFIGAGMIVFPSDFEGFGLPVVEGMRARIPVVIGPEAATQEMAGGHAAVMADWTPAALVHAVRVAAAFDDAHLDAAAEHAAAFTWTACVQRTAEALEELVGLRRSDHHRPRKPGR